MICKCWSHIIHCSFYTITSTTVECFENSILLSSKSYYMILFNRNWWYNMPFNCPPFFLKITCLPFNLSPSLFFSIVFIYLFHTQAYFKKKCYASNSSFSTFFLCFSVSNFLINPYLLAALLLLLTWTSHQRLSIFPLLIFLGLNFIQLKFHVRISYVSSASFSPNDCVACKIKDVLLDEKWARIC